MYNRTVRVNCIFCCKKSIEIHIIWLSGVEVQLKKLEYHVKAQLFLSESFVQKVRLIDSLHI